MQFKFILDFWFNELTASDWFAKNKKLDNQIHDRFAKVHHQARKGELWHWRVAPESALAEIIILDQFSRNMYRDQAKSFRYDDMSLLLAQNAVSQQFHKQLKESKRAFLLMPYMHSESKVIHEQAVILFNAPGLERNLEYELKHKAIIDQFGRYPHRNIILGRKSTQEELKFLQQKGTSF